MLGIGMQEILIILVVALIVIGPKRLPDLARTLGKGLAEFKKAADDLQQTVRLDLERDKHEEFRKKYPHLVPEEEEEEDREGEREKGRGGETAENTGDKPSGDDIGSEANETIEGAQPSAEPASKPVISYNPDEIEGPESAPDEPRND